MDKRRIQIELEVLGSIEVEIDNYRFVKDERNLKGIEVYLVDTDGLYEYIETITLDETHFKTLDTIEKLADIAIRYYKNQKEQ